MIQSMTAFARRAEQYAWGTAVWEIRSVNHRYLEVSIRLPEALRELESALRERTRQILARGKVEIFLKYVAQQNPNALINLNLDLVKQLAQSTQQLNKYFPQLTPPTVTNLLAWPGVIEVDEIQHEKISELLLKLFNSTLDELIVMRKREGAAITDIINDRLQQVMQWVIKLKARQTDILKNFQQRLLQRFEEVKISPQPERLEQELLFIAQKMDIAEELERLEMHIKEAQKTLKKGGAVGRRMEFLLQEMHREANTLAAKTIDADTSMIGVELRVLIEQMREQIQNIE